MEINDKVKHLLRELELKYDAMGQDMVSYLEGLLYADITKYWDYIQTDTLLSLQKPKTNIPDEFIFIVYHQVTELYFRLCLHELQQISIKKDLTTEWLTARVKRMTNYFENLTRSFSIMIEGMEPEQFLKFRMSLLPASGFQSGQYRMIEICSTPMINLVGKDFRAQFNDNSSIEEMFDKIYWKAGATETATGKKTLTLTQFEAKYAETLIKLGYEYQHSNLWLRAQSVTLSEELKNQLRKFDSLVNVEWPMVHMRSAVRYLQTGNEAVNATGGTNWRQYLAPRLQKRVFFPTLWSEEDMANWGTASVMN